MREVELKFQVPPGQAGPLAQLLQARAAAPVRAMRLQATYWDTPQRHLAQAGMALRVRRERGRWVQTLKGLGEDALTRLEHEVLRRERGARPPPVDPALHRGTEVGERLAGVLMRAAQELAADVPAAEEAPEAWPEAGAAGDAATSGTLRPAYGTDIRRRCWRWRGPWGEVEMALDEGRVVAGDQSEPVRELEIEWLDGSPAAVFDAAVQVLQAVPVWVDLRTKAERGDRLSRGLQQVPAAKSAGVQIPHGAGLSDAARAVLGAVTKQALTNAQEIAGGSGAAEHLHQLRVALRRARTALRLFDGALAFDLAPWQRDAAWLFRQSGAARDLDALGLSVVPALKAAGAPLADLPLRRTEAVDMPALLRSRPVQMLWLQWLAYAHGLAPADDPARQPPPGPARDWVRGQLRRWWRSIRRDVRRFDELDEPAWHRLRKRIKRLRYAAEFAASWHGERAVATTLKEMARIQDAMGELNDVLTALGWYAEAAQHDPRAWFAVGWLTARRDVLRRRARRRLRAWVRRQPYWRAGR